VAEQGCPLAPPISATDGRLAWMASLAADWLALGAVAFNRADRKARRDGTLIRY
jgi:hypothetical protein